MSIFFRAATRLLWGLLAILLVGCSPLYEKQITYYVPQWGKYIRLTGANRGEHKIIFSNDISDLRESNIDKLDYVVMDDSYRDGIWHFLIVNQIKPDTLFVMSSNYHPVTIPMRQISRHSLARHFKIDGTVFKCEDGYFGFYIVKRRFGAKLVVLGDNTGMWELEEVNKNCLFL